jgi:hypothetical protein
MSALSDFSPSIFFSSHFHFVVENYLISLCFVWKICMMRCTESFEKLQENSSTLMNNTVKEVKATICTILLCMKFLH